MDGPSVPATGHLRVGRRDGWPPVVERRPQDPAYRPTHRHRPALCVSARVSRRGAMPASEELWTAGVGGVADGFADGFASVLRRALVCVTAHVVEDVGGDTEPER